MICHDRVLAVPRLQPGFGQREHPALICPSLKPSWRRLLPWRFFLFNLVCSRFSVETDMGYGQADF